VVVTVLLYCVVSKVQLELPVVLFQQEKAREKKKKSLLDYQRVRNKNICLEMDLFVKLAGNEQQQQLLLLLQEFHRVKEEYRSNILYCAKIPPSNNTPDCVIKWRKLLVKLVNGTAGDGIKRAGEKLLSLISREKEALREYFAMRKEYVMMPPSLGRRKSEGAKIPRGEAVEDREEALAETRELIVQASNAVQQVRY
jgi:hypothetical protein